MKALILNIYGNVQGVGFRVSAKKIAEDLGITGWIRNEEDGNVICEVVGTSDSCDSFLTWCHGGPFHATVEKVEVKEIPVTRINGFTIFRN